MPFYVKLSFRFANHENSKKHRENVAALRAEMEEDEGKAIRYKDKKMKVRLLEKREKRGFG